MLYCVRLSYQFCEYGTASDFLIYVQLLFMCDDEIKKLKLLVM